MGVSTFHYFEEVFKTFVEAFEARMPCLPDWPMPYHYSHYAAQRRSHIFLPPNATTAVTSPRLFKSPLSMLESRLLSAFMMRGYECYFLDNYRTCITEE